jgi:hypothetical protein
MQAKSTVVAAISIVALGLALLLASPTVQGIAVYLHLLNWPTCDLALPSKAQSEGVFTTIGRVLAFIEPNAAPYDGMQHVKSIVIDDGKLNGWHAECITCVTTQTPPKLTVLYLHGNGGRVLA